MNSLKASAVVAVSVAEAAVADALVAFLPSLYFFALSFGFILRLIATLFYLVYFFMIYFLS